MPIRPACRSNPQNTQTTTDLIAALLFVAWAEMRLHRTVDYKTLIAEWQKIKDELPPS